MDFSLNKEHEMARELFRQFAENEVMPLAQSIDEEERFPRETVEKMASLGFMGISVPREYGGQGCDQLTYLLCVEELAKVCATTAVILSAHASLACDTLLKHGTEAQKQSFLVPLAKGEKLGAFALTEPNAGTDASAQQTTAKLEGDAYVLNGNKIFITNGKEADIYIVFAMTDRTRGTKGITAFVVEKGSDGFSFGAKERKMGIRGSSTYELCFSNCRIPVANRLGEEGKGFGIAMQALDGGRIGIAAQATGIAMGALDRTVSYVKTRKQFGTSISAFQNTQFQISEMATRIQAAEMLVFRAGLAKETKRRFSVEASMAKLFASATAVDVTARCVQLHGGYGYTREYEVERMMRDAKVTEIYEGTSEVQRMVIASSLL